MRAFYYDTETTGIPDFKSPSDAPHQPHIFQAAALLVDLDTWDVVSSLDMTVRPDGWVIPPDVTELTGWTTEMAHDLGVREDLVTDAMFSLWERSDLRVGHTQSFDARIMRIAIKRFLDEERAEKFKGSEAVCTALLSKPILNLPATENMLAKSNFKVKTPTLKEAYFYFFGEQLANAHSAWPDAEATMRVHRKILERA